MPVNWISVHRDNGKPDYNITLLGLSGLVLDMNEMYTDFLAGWSKNDIEWAQVVICCLLSTLQAQGYTATLHLRHGVSNNKKKLYSFLNKLFGLTTTKTRSFYITEFLWRESIAHRWTPLPTWWRHKMKTFSALLDIGARNSPVTGEFQSQRPLTWNFDVFFDLRMNKRLSKQSWGWCFEPAFCSLWRHCYADPVICKATPCYDAVMGNNLCP